MYLTFNSFFKIPVIFFAFVSLISCENKQTSTSSESNSDSIKICAGQIKYIKIEDAQEFSPSWSKENCVVVNEVGEPEDLHPSNSLSGMRSEIMGYTQVYLIGVDYQNLALRPIAVKSMPLISENGLEYTYELNTDIRFDDGAKLTIEDVVFTFKANKCPLTNNPHAKPYLENLIDIQTDTKNPNVFKLIMKDKYIQNITFLTDYPIMQRTFFDRNNVLSNYSFARFDDKKFNTDNQKELKIWANEFNSSKYGRDVKYLVGAGPYRIEKWDAGQSITIVLKNNHWTKASLNKFESSYPDKIIFKINRDPNSQKLELKSQAIDVSTSLSTAILLELQADENFRKNYNSRFTDTYNYSYLAMNLKPDEIKHKKLFTDKKVRRAMALLAPLDDINKIISKGKNKRIAGPVSSLKPDFNPNLKIISFDIEAAKKLLDEAGWKDSDGDNIRDKIIDGAKVKMEFNMNYMTTQIEWKDIAQMISEQMYKAGVKANLNPLDYAVLVEAARNHDFDMMMCAWGGSFAPEDYTQLWHTSSWATKGSNFSGFGNSDSDVLIDSIKHTLDNEKRYAMTRRLQELIYEEQPYVFLFSSVRKNVIHKRFGNQEIYFDRPGTWVSNLKLLANPGTSIKPQPTN